MSIYTAKITLLKKIRSCNYKVSSEKHYFILILLLIIFRIIVKSLNQKIGTGVDKLEHPLYN